MKKAYLFLPLILLAGYLTTGCNILPSNSAGPAEVKVQMKIESGSTILKQDYLSTMNDELVIEEVKLYIDELELDGTRGTSDFEVENFVAVLPLDGSPLTITKMDIPAGFYDELEIEIEKPDNDDTSLDDPDFRDETGSYSIVIKGMYNGESFTFRSREDFELEIDLYPPLEISDFENSTLMITVDVSGWFKGYDGSILDPKDYRNTEIINKNIEKSFEAFEDKYDDDDDDDDDDD